MVLHNNNGFNSNREYNICKYLRTGNTGAHKYRKQILYEEKFYLGRNRQQKQY